MPAVELLSCKHDWSRFHHMFSPHLRYFGHCKQNTHEQRCTIDIRGCLHVRWLCYSSVLQYNPYTNNVKAYQPFSLSGGKQDLLFAAPFPFLSIYFIYFSYVWRKKEIKYELQSCTFRCTWVGVGKYVQLDGFATIFLSRYASTFEVMSVG